MADVHLSDLEYVDSGYHLVHFADEVWCSCPKCTDVAIVRAQASAGPSVEAARLVCRNCPYARDWSIDVWLGPVIGTAQGLCRACGSPLEKEFRRRRFRRDLPESAVVQCQYCRRASNVELRWSKPYDPAPLDPYLGLPLYLRTECGRGKLWAYNPRHLEELLRFARARIRRRPPTRGLSMIARLPPWVKSAKNRDKVIRCLETLVEKTRATS